MNSLDTCTSSHSRDAREFRASRVIAGLLTVLIGGLSGCSLFSIDPDEIDVADGDTGEEAADGADDVGGTASEEGVGTDTEFETSDTGTSDAADNTTNDQTSDGVSTTDDGSDTSLSPCEASDEVVLGENPVTIAAGTSNFEGSCGGSESETLYSFTVPAGGDYYFSLVGAEFSGVLYGLDEACVENANSCSNTGDMVHKTLSSDETVILVVDSDLGVGSATLVITGP